MYATVKDTQSTLKRAQKQLKYFARAIYTDNFMICLLFLIAVGIIVVIVLAVKNKKKS